MKSDIYIVSVDYKEGFAEEVAKIAKLQIEREEPRILVSTFIDQAFVKLVLVFELASTRPLATP